MAVRFSWSITCVLLAACARSTASPEGDAAVVPEADASMVSDARDAALAGDVDAGTPVTPSVDADVPDPPDPVRDAGQDASGTLPDEPVTKSEQVGGVGGNVFDDALQLPEPPAIATLLLSGGARLDRIEVTYRDGTTFSHGGPEGTAVSLALSDGELLTGARLCVGTKDSTVRIFHARFNTSLGRMLESGGETDDCSELAVPEDRHIGGFYGRAGDEVDALGLVLVPR